VTSCRVGPGAFRAVATQGSRQVGTARGRVCGPEDRNVIADVARLARLAPGCLDFVQAADPLGVERITIYERWESDADLDRFRASGGPEQPEPDVAEPAVPPLLDAEVRRYPISSVEEP
jgi:quinol monooxygenase YgiN